MQALNKNISDFIKMSLYETIKQQKQSDHDSASDVI